MYANNGPAKRNGQTINITLQPVLASMLSELDVFEEERDSPNSHSIEKDPLLVLILLCRT